MASSMKVAGSAFTIALHQEYLDLAAFEYGEDESDSVTAYSKRSMAAGKNKPTDPEAISKRKLSKKNVGELTSGRSDLMAAFGNGAKSREPGHAAHAQAIFDCWMEQQEENHQPKHIAACRDGFKSVLAKLKAPKVMAKPMPKPKPMPKLTGPYIGYFGFYSVKIPLNQEGIINTAGVDAETVKPGSVTVRGHTDLAGDNKYNVTLSNARTTAVAKALAAAGISSSIMTQSHHGEANLKVATADGKREKKNRRVEITFKRQRLFFRS